jgi:hypothetical protein
MASLISSFDIWIASLITTEQTETYLWTRITKEKVNNNVNGYLHPDTAKHPSSHLQGCRKGIGI